MVCESKFEMKEMLACPVALYCLGMCSLTNCPGNAGMVNL
jgi:hypothetical protein